MIGKTISHYTILEKIAEGGMGVIYLAEDNLLKRNVVLKFLLSTTMSDPEIKSRFLREAQAAAALNHPNICTIYGIDETEHKTFIAMEYIEGDNLRTRIKTTAIDLRQSINIILKIAGGLSHAHSKGIVHRDIKSANILLDNNNEVKITDFGLAKLKDTPQITKKKSTLGTVAYMSPEQLKGDEVDSRTDIWSLGVVFYELLTSHLPFESEYEQATIYSILQERPTEITSFRPDIPQNIEQIIYKMLSKNANDRYQSIDEFIIDLENSEKDNASIFKIAIKKFFLPTIIVSIILVLSGIIFFFLTPNHKYENIRLIVLPFENLGNSDDDYFTDGVYDETISRLSELKGLAVVPRIKALQFSHNKTNFDKIKSLLNVKYLIDGTVLLNHSYNHDKIKIITNLIRLEDETLLWSEKYEGDFKDIFKIQTDIAERVAKQLDIKILEPERELISGQPTINMDAYRLVAQARKIIRTTQSKYISREKIVKDYLRANKLIEKAIKLDSAYFSALIFLSHNHSWLYDTGIDRTPERKQSAKKLLDQVLAIQPGNPSAMWQLAVYYYRIENDFKRSYDLLNEIRKSYPNRESLWMAIVERRLGLWNDAVEHFLEAEKQSPYDDDTPLLLGSVYSYLREYDLADKAFNRSINNHPTYVGAIEEKSLNHILWNGDIVAAKNVWNQLPDTGKGDDVWLFISRMERNYIGIVEQLNNRNKYFYETFENYFLKPLEYAQVYSLREENKKSQLYADSAVIYLKTIEDKKAGDAIFHSVIGLAYAFDKNKEAALRHGLKATGICPLQKDALLAPFYLTYLAKIYTVLGEREKAINTLKHLLEIPSYISAAYLKLDPIWDSLRDHPKFRVLVGE